MGELRGSVSLAHEAAMPVRFMSGCRTLESHIPLQPQIPGPVDPTHPTLPDLLQNLVVTYLPADLGGFLRWACRFSPLVRVRTGEVYRPPLLREHLSRPGVLRQKRFDVTSQLVITATFGPEEFVTPLRRQLLSPQKEIGDASMTLVGHDRTPAADR
jgi:hypothetical protein